MTTTEEALVRESEYIPRAQTIHNLMHGEGAGETEHPLITQTESTTQVIMGLWQNRCNALLLAGSRPTTNLTSCPCPLLTRWVGNHWE